MSHALKW